MLRKIVIFCYLSISFLSGCSNQSLTLIENGQAKPEVEFIDISKFDRDMQASLSSNKFNSVEVSFYEKVSPNKIPERLQKWLSSVEKNGGNVSIKQPAGEIVAKDPMTLFTIFSSLYSGLKKLAEEPFDKPFESVRGRNAVIQLERNKDGVMVVQRIDFIMATSK